MLLLLSVVIAAVLGGCGPKASPQLTYQDTEKAPDPIYITGISTIEDTQGATVHIEGNRMLTYTSVKQSEPLGIVFYFPDTALGEIAAVQSPESNLITRINASELATDEKTVRVEIGLSHDSTYTVDRNENGLKVSFPIVLADESSSEPSEPSDQTDEDAPAQMGIETADTSKVRFETTPASKLSGVIGRIRRRPRCRSRRSRRYDPGLYLFYAFKPTTHCL